MKTIAERAAELGQLRTFDPEAFRGDGEAPQELCNFVLAMALVFNDCRDLLIWAEEIQEQTPERGQLNRYGGEHGGMMTHVFRLLAALVHELGELIRQNGRWLHEPFFRDTVLPKLSKEHQEMWRRLRELAQGGKPAVKAMDDMLDFLRNNLMYHYDASALVAGFEKRFPAGSSDTFQQPVVSLGQRVRGVRFYFADAAALDLVEVAARERGLKPLGPKTTELLRGVSTTLAEIVRAFIQARQPWRDFAEEP